MSSPEYDIIGAEVHRKALENLTREMASTMTRTSGSEIVTEGKDCSTCFLDTEPEILSFAAYVLFHMGSSYVSTKMVSDLVSDRDLKPGDGWVVNDPHSGAMHQADVSVIMPIFYHDEHLAWGFANMHVLDVGGVGISGYAPGAHDVYQEGLRFPPVQVIRDGRIGSEWERFIDANVRGGGRVLNDMRSMIAANNTASRKIKEIVDEFGLARYREFCEINKNLTETLLRERIARIPDGVYEIVDWNEFDGHGGPDLLLELRLQLEVRDTDLYFRFSGVPQIDAFVNSAKGAMWGQTATALLVMLAYGDLAVNGGFWRAVHVDLGEPGTIVNSTPPAPCSNAHSEVGMRACKMVKHVLSQAMALSDDPVLRGRVAGQTQDGFPAVLLYGENQNGGTSVMFYIETVTGQGGGAQTITDGQDAYGCTCGSGGAMPHVEGHEHADPVFVHWRRLVPNSGGPGQFRGGQGLEQALSVRYVEQVGGPACNACAQLPPQGFGGGYPAATGTFGVLKETNLDQLLEAAQLPLSHNIAGASRSLRSKETHLVIKRSDVVITTCGGGGGVGDPLLRAPARVQADVRDGYVTRDHAEHAYGVLLSDSGTVDLRATAARRQEMRRERIGSDPTRELRPPESPGVSIVIADIGRDSYWHCGHCHTPLAPVDRSWREEGAIAREKPIAERYAELRMYVRERLVEPRVVLREYFCPACAGALSIDVSTDAVEPLRVPQLAT